MIERRDYYTPFPPDELHGFEHQMEFKNDDTSSVILWCEEHAGERGKDWWYPARGIVTFRDPSLRCLFKLTWG